MKLLAPLVVAFSLVSTAALAQTGSALPAPPAPFAEVLPGTNPQFVMVLLRLQDAGLTQTTEGGTAVTRAVFADIVCQAFSYDNAKLATFIDAGRSQWQLRSVVCSRRLQP